MKASLKWLGVILAIGLISLAVSSKTYLASVNQKEIMIAEAQPESVTTNPFNLSGFKKTGQLKLYLIDKQNWGAMLFTFKYKAKTYKYTVNNVPVKTAFSVKPGESANLHITRKRDGVSFYGWLKPSSPGTRNCKKDTTPTITKAETNNEVVISVQCWNDDGNNDDPYDEFEIVITQDKGVTASPSPGVTASPSPGAATADFQIRNFNDLDGDGQKDANEGPINQIWQFQYRIGDHDWQAIQTAAGNGLSNKITVAKNSRVEVEELPEPNWLVTSSVKQTKTLSDANTTYTFDFGNRLVSPSPGSSSSPSLSPSPSTGSGGNEVSPSPSSAGSGSQPNTGAPTWLTAGALLTGLGLLTVKLLLKI